MNQRIHKLTPAMHDGLEGQIKAQVFQTSHSYDDKPASEMRVQANSVGDWLEIDITKFGDKRSTSVSHLMNRAQAIALRDLLNTAFGGSAKVARTVKGSVYGFSGMTIVGGKT